MDNIIREIEKLKVDMQQQKLELQNFFARQNWELQNFMQNQKQEILWHINNLTNTTAAARLDIVESQQAREGIYHFQYLLRRAHVAGKYYELFYEFYLRNQRGEKVVFVDCGAHAGVFSDIALACVESAMLLSLINTCMRFWWICIKIMKNLFYPTRQCLIKMAW